MREMCLHKIYIKLSFPHILGNNRVQRWLPGATSGTTIVGGTSGTGPDELRFPETILFDRSGNLIVVDRQNNRIQFFNITTNDA